MSPARTNSNSEPTDSELQQTNSRQSGGGWIGSSLLNRSLRASVFDGMAHALMLGFGESFLGAFGVFLRATILQIGLLSNLPQLAGAIAQNFGVWMIERFPNRREAITIGVVINASCWFGFALISLLALTPTPLAVWIVILLAVCYFSSAGFISPIWNSLIGDLVPKDRRGEFFGLRNRFATVSSFSAMLLGGLILGLGQGTENERFGFTLVFCLAGIARLVSAGFTRSYDNPPYSYAHEHYFSFIQFIRRAPWSNFAKFVMFGGAINFAVSFAAPYFALHALRDLRWSYETFIVVTAVSSITQFFTMKPWGRLCDRYGNKQILQFCGFGIALTPIPWIFSANPWVIALAHIYVGLVWSGYNLATSNFIFDAVSPPKIARCAAYQAVVNALFFLAGSLSGGWVATHITSVSPLLAVFGISAILRLAIASILLPRFSEVRVVQPLRTKELLFAVTDIRPLFGTTMEVVSSVWRRQR